MMCLGVGLLASILFGTLGLTCLFSSPNWGSFLSLFFQIHFQLLALPILLLAPLWLGCWHVWGCSRVFLFFFFNSCFFFCSDWMFIYSLCSNSLIWILASFPSVLVPCRFFFLLLSVTFIFSPSCCCHTQWVLWASWWPVFWTLHLMGWLSLLHLALFLGFVLFFHLGHISLSPQFGSLTILISVY